MKAYLDEKLSKNTGKRTYHCDGCDQDYDVEDEPWTEATAIYVHLGHAIGGHDRSDDAHCSYLYLPADTNTNQLGALEHVWYCHDGCFHHDEGTGPEVENSSGVVWRCGLCEQTFEADDYGDPADAEREAVACCA